MLGCAAPALYGCAAAEEVAPRLGAQSLTGAKVWLNVRGVLRSGSGATERYVVEVGAPPLSAIASPTAARLRRGLSAVTADVVLPAPVGRVLEGPLAGQAVGGPSQTIIGASWVQLLARGTGAAHPGALGDVKGLSDTTFKAPLADAVCF